MKRPNLVYNHYFPFYTQKIAGEKKYYYDIRTVIHISENIGILIHLGYKQKKIYEISIERISDSTKLYDYRMNGNYISYVDFAKAVETLYRLLSKVQRTLSPEQAYIRHLVFSSYFKCNNSIEFELEYKKIFVRVEELNYRIESCKMVRIETPSNYTSEEDITMKKISDVVDVINNQTTYKEIDNNEFEKRLNGTWEYFTEYFESPKFIRKSEYIPK
jgi:hypothetical protein